MANEQLNVLLGNFIIWLAGYNTSSNLYAWGSGHTICKGGSCPLGALFL